MRRFNSVFHVLTIGSALVSLAAGQPLQRPFERPQIRQGSLKAGDTAPDFTLQDVAGKETVKLSSLRGKPVVLMFGSCTCPPFVRSTELVEQLYEQYQDRVQFVLVYVREAHPTDGWAQPNNPFQIRSPRSIDERRKVARDFAAKLKLSVPIVVDSIDDATEAAYSVWPNRMVIVDAAGKIADAGVAGPQGTSTSARKAPSILDRLLSEAK
jgi:thiol-disulfide isomerase/thioredoxin